MVLVFGVARLMLDLLGNLREPKILNKYFTSFKIFFYLKTLDKVTCPKFKYTFTFHIHGNPGRVLNCV